MHFSLKSSARAARFALVAMSAVSGAAIVMAGTKTEARQGNAAEPWTNAQTIEAADLVREIGGPKNRTAPTILYVGFRTLFEGGHIPGAVFHGTASTEKGLAEWKEWAGTLPRSANVVIYCGCCPFLRCPNIRPAYKTLQEMGFAHVRVLVLPTSFAADWVEKGYPILKGL